MRIGKHDVITDLDILALKYQILIAARILEAIQESSQ